MDYTLRDEIFMRANELRYSEDRAETAHWLNNEYALLLTQEQGQEFLERILDDLHLVRSQERDDKTSL
jgi:hypothetical protein